MTFLNILKNIGTDINAGMSVVSAIGTAAPGLVAAIPGATVGETIVKGILDIEKAFPASGLGSLKNQIVTTATRILHPGTDAVAISAAITRFVDAANEIAKLLPVPSAPANK